MPQFPGERREKYKSKGGKRKDSGRGTRPMEKCHTFISERGAPGRNDGKAIDERLLAEGEEHSVRERRIKEIEKRRCASYYLPKGDRRYSRGKNQAKGTSFEMGEKHIAWPTFNGGVAREKGCKNGPRMCLKRNLREEGSQPLGYEGEMESGKFDDLARAAVQPKSRGPAGGGGCGGKGIFILCITRSEGTIPVFYEKKDWRVQRLANGRTRRA